MKVTALWRDERGASALEFALTAPVFFLFIFGIIEFGLLFWTQLGLQRKPCGILNVDGYYDHLLQMFDHAVAEQFVKPVHRQMVINDASPESLVDRLLTYEVPVVDKWLGRQQT